jgi:hypothetical protein
MNERKKEREKSGFGEFEWTVLELNEMMSNGKERRTRPTLPDGQCEKRTVHNVAIATLYIWPKAQRSRTRRAPAQT